MKRVTALAVCLVLAFRTAAAVAQGDPILPPGDETPVLRLSIGNPTGYITGLSWTPDEATLYASSWDKQVHAWDWSPEEGGYRYQAAKSLRVPIGGGLHGALSTLEISDDGQWLATAGFGLSRNDMGTRREGWVISEVNHLSEQDRQDRGLIYVFHLQEKKLHLLRGHRGPVRTLKFVPGTAGNRRQLVSLADETANDEVRSVVRLWAVASEKELGSWNKLPQGLAAAKGKIPVTTQFNPSLTTWLDSQDQKPRVALALSVLPEFLVWNPYSPSPDQRITGRQRSEDQINLLSVAHSPAGLLVGGQGGLAAWNAAGNQRIAKLPLKENQAVRAIAWRPAAESGPPSAAVLVMTNGQNQSYNYRLLAVEVSSNPPGLKVIGNPEGQDVYVGDVRELSLAAGKSRVAVAGMPGEQIKIFGWNQLNAPGAVKSQVLHTGGQALGSVAFVQNSADPPQWGIALDTKPQRIKSDAWLNSPPLRVFDISARSFTTSDGWKLNQPDLGKWRISPLDEAKSSGKFTVVSDEGSSVAIDVNQWEEPGRQHSVTASVFSPPSPLREMPLLIVASHLNGEVHLRGFRADTGAELLWFIGHIGAIRDLAVSADGRMLLSLSEDRTVSLWPLTQLEQVIDRGSPGDVVVDAQNGKLLVHQPGKTSRLQAADEVIGIEDRGEIRPLETFRQFNQEFRREQPGAELTFEIRRNGNVQKIPVSVAQAVRERKPLCTLYFSEFLGRQPSWALWHPSGRFDSSGPGVEQSLGWHFNTGDRANPTQFVTMDQHRDNFFRPGLLPQLIEDDGVPAAGELPNLSLLFESIDEDGQKILERDPTGRVRLQSPQARLIVFPDRDVPINQLTSMRWYWGDAKSGEFLWDDYGRWTADVADIPLDRSEVKVRVELKTAGAFPQVAEVRGLVVTLPAPPQLAIRDVRTNKYLPAEMETPEDNLQIEVETSEPALLKVSVRRGNVEIEATTHKIQKHAPQKFELALAAGDNEILVQAVHPNAPPETKRDETAISTHLIRRTEDSLKIDIHSVEAAGDPTRNNLIQPSTTSIVTQSPQIRITGTIRSTAAIQSAEFAYGDVRRSELPAAKTFPIDEVVALDSGEHPWKITAVSGGKTVSKFVTIDYQPRLPKLAAVRFQNSLLPGRQFPARREPESNAIYHGWHHPKLEVTADILPPDGGQLMPGDYVIELVVNDDVHLQGTEAIDDQKSDRHRFAGEIPLQPGFNRVAILVRNNSGAEPAVVEHEVWYRRPPVVTACNLPMDQVVENPVVISGTVESIPELQHVVIEIDGVKRQVTPQQVAGSADQWQFELADISLPQEKTTVLIRAVNAESASIEDLERVVHLRQPAPPSEVEITVGNKLSEHTTSRHVALELQFQSRGRPIHAVEIYDVAGRKIQDANAELQQAGHPRSFEWRPVLDLEEGPDNAFEIRAYDDLGGEPAREQVKFSQVPPAVRLTIASFDGKPVIQTNEHWKLKDDQSVNESPAKLRGHLTTPADHDPRNPISVKAIVNGIHRQTVTAAPANQRNEQAFQFDLILNWKKTNHVELQVQGTKLSKGEGTLHAACRQPDEEQELFLLLISPKERDLKAQVFKQLSIERNTQGDFESKAAGFKKVHCLTKCELTGEEAVGNTAIRSLEKVIRKHIVDHRVKNAVILIFYHGKDAVTREGSLLMADDRTWDDFPNRSRGSDDQRLTDRNLAIRAKSIKAGNLLFVEVSQREENPHPWQQPAEMAVFRRTIGERENFPLLVDLNPVLPVHSKLGKIENSIQLRGKNAPIVATTDPAAYFEPGYVPPFMKNLHFGGGAE